MAKRKIQLRGRDNLVDLQEISLKLDELNKNLTEIGDSLWHYYFRKRVIRIRKSNNYAEFLGRYK